jgi:ABC-2 type transport system ATP-binding protein
MIAEAPMDEIVAEHGLSDVLVRADRQDDLAVNLVRHGGRVEPAEHGALAVAGLSSSVIGAIALGEGIALIELTPRPASLEEAFLELTHDVTLHAAAVAAPEGN